MPQVVITAILAVAQKFLGAVTIITLYATLAVLLPSVTSLPFDLDVPLSVFAQTIHNILYYMPWFEIIWQLFIFGLGIKLGLFVIQIYMFVSNLAKS